MPAHLTKLLVFITTCSAILPAQASSNLDTEPPYGRGDSLPEAIPAVLEWGLYKNIHSEGVPKEPVTGVKPVPSSLKPVPSSLKPMPSYLKQIHHWRRRRDTRQPWWQSIFFPGKEKPDKGVPTGLIMDPESERRTGGNPAKLFTNKGQPGTTRSQRPPIEQPAVSNLTKMLGGLLPNTYFSKPRFRYPYYDRAGKGYLLYGYGEKDLYEYSVFKPLEGYY
jgi:hypothetical protein